MITSSSTVTPYLLKYFAVVVAWNGTAMKSTLPPRAT